MTPRHACRVATPVLALLLLAGCTTIAPGFREQEALAFRDALEAETAAALPPGTVLGLDDCLRLALARNLDLKATDLGVELARLDRDIAFAGFLPQVTASASVTTWDRRPASRIFGPMSTPMHDQTLRDTSIDVRMPVLVPATWFLYNLRANGLESVEYQRDYARQMIALDVTATYFECLALDASAHALRSQLAQVRALATEVTHYVDEGLAPAWQRDQLIAAIAAREAALAQTERTVRQRKGELLQLMGLSPTAELPLKSDVNMKEPTEGLADLVFLALCNHPRLHAADRDVAMAEDAVKLAITGFLPNLSGFSSRAYTSEARSKYATSLVGGFAGFMTVFDGFANVSAYRQAKVRAEGARLARESACLALAASVQAAWLNVETARDEARVAALGLKAAESRLLEVEARAAEGLLLGSERLEAVAARDGSQAQCLASDYLYRLSVAVLRNTVGNTYAGVDQ